MFVAIKRREASDFLALDYKDYENLPNLFSQRDGLMLGKTRCQQGRSSGGEIVAVPCSPASRGSMKNVVKKKFGKSLQPL